MNPAEPAGADALRHAADAALAEEQNRNEQLYREEHDAAGGPGRDWIGYQNARLAATGTPA